MPVSDTNVTVTMSPIVEYSTEINVAVSKLDGVGPVENRLSTA